MIEVGKILQNRYRVEKQIGQGGMGKVYVASDQRFNSTVAIKETIFEDKNLRSAFEREARLLNSLKHLALPRVSDHFTEDDGQFLVMEYIAGEDLAEMMEREGAAFPLNRVLDWANQLCDALNYLHARNIIHRDIKPQNLKLTPGGQIVLLDFGLAKGNPTDAQHQTAAKSIFGYSRNYASLEQIQGTGTEPRSDLYSLAATIYHLLTGIPPADALTRAMNVLNKKPDPLIAANVINPKVPAGVANVLRASMALNADERPASANELQQMLDDSDKYVDAEAVNSAVAPLSADFLTQETKIKPLTTKSSNQSQVATKIISASESGANSYETTVENNDSVVTNVSPAKFSAKGSNRTRKIGIGALAALLLAGSAFAAIFLSISKTPQNTVQENSNTLPTNFVIQTEITNTTQNTSTTTSDSPATTAVNSNAKSTKDSTVAKTVSNTKNQTRASKNTKEPESYSVTDEDGTQWKISDDRIESKDMIVDENGVRMKNRAGKVLKTPAPPQIPTAVYQGLTPEQIQQLEQLKNMRRIVVVKPPTPKPTP